MLKLIQSNKFKKDLQIIIKRKYNIDELNKVVNMLANQEKLPSKYNDHSLHGNYDNFRECHIKPDWLLIYHIDDYELELFLLRTGTHSDLF